MNKTFDKIEELVIYCKNMYRSYGYKQFKMSKFEEYDLYVANKNFLVSDSIITFTERNGKLMALKPDVTISIVKNASEDRNLLDKVYYNENVYRLSGSTNEFKETMQMGIEYIGGLDLYSMGEVISLAAKSLAAISPDYILDISHMDFISSLIESLGIGNDLHAEILSCISQKNAAQIISICEKAGCNLTTAQKLASLTKLYGRFEDVLSELCKLSINEKTELAIEELNGIYDILKVFGCEKNLYLDFSLTNDMNYYNGITFQGFINQVPSCVLSGGRYDKLLAKFGKQGGAIGFAVYMDELDILFQTDNGFDVDVLLIYDDITDKILLSDTVRKLVSENKSVRAEKSDLGYVKYRELLNICGKGDAGK